MTSENLRRISYNCRRMDKTRFLFAYFHFGFIGLFGSAVFAEAEGGRAAPDSVRREVVDGEVYIIHEVEPKENYYALGRRYNASPGRIMAANGNQNLKPGNFVRIPIGRRDDAAGADRAEQADTIDPKSVLTEYSVGKSETLYRIARRFATTVEAIKKMNNLDSDTLRAGQVLRIPDSDYVPPAAIVQEMPDLEPDAEPEDMDFETNRYGIREKTEKGIGIWMESLETDGQSNLALHRTAPVGTILKITNPMSKNVTYAKVVGRFVENAETRDAIVVLSKSAAAYIGALDRRFLIEIAYGQPFP